MTEHRSFPVDLLEHDADGTPVVDPKLWRGAAFAIPPGVALWVLILWMIGWL